MPIIDLDPPELPQTQDGNGAEAAQRPCDPLFRVEGKVYSIVRDFSAAESLSALEIAVESGYAASLLYLARIGLGDDGWAALKGATGMSPEQYKQIMDVIQAKALATSKAMTGK